MPSRRIHRRVFRRLRIFLPLILLVALLLAMFLPLSAPWMGARVRSELKDRFGLDVELDRLELLLASARGDIYGLRLQSANGGEPFTLRQIEVDGVLSGLLAGGERWPDVVTISVPPTLELRRGEDGRYQVQGGFRTLMEEIQRIQKRTAPQPKPATAAEASSRRLGRTPAIVLQDLRINMDPPATGFPEIKIVLDRLSIPDRPMADSPIRVALNGSATATVSERFSLTGSADPLERRAALEGTLSGFRFPFSLPNLGWFELAAQDVAVEASALEESDGSYSGSLTLRAARFQVARQRVGGERWQDRALTIRLLLRFDPQTEQLEVREASFSGEQIDTVARGSVVLREDFPGNARLTVNRLPAGALALARGELAGRLNVEFDPTSTSPTLRLDAQAYGNFAEPASLQGEASVLLRGWALGVPGVPERVSIRSFDVVASLEKLTIRDIALGFGGLTLRAKGEVPVAINGGGTPGIVRVEAAGDAASAVETLTRLQLMPSELVELRAPIRLQADLPLLLHRTEGRVALSTDTLTTSLSWGDGDLVLRRFADPIRLSGGFLQLTQERMELSRVRAAMRTLAFTLSGGIARPRNAAQLRTLPFEGELMLAAEAQDLITVLGREVRLPALPRDLRGALQLELSAVGTTAAPEDSSYTLRLLVEDGGATVPTPHRTLPVEDLSLDLLVDNQQIQLRSLGATIKDGNIGPSRIELQASALDGELRATTRVRTRFEMLTSILARDLSDLVMEGTLPASGTAVATAARPLPPGPDVLRRWITYFRQPGFRIGTKPGADLLLDYEAVYTQEEPVTVFAREFPVPITNIRGSARFTPENGIAFDELQADIGSARDVRISGNVVIGKPTKVRFTAEMDHLDINQWTRGWGARPWASKPIAYIPRWKSNPNPVPFVEVEGLITADSCEFMNYKGGAVSGSMLFKGWSRIPAKLWIRDLEVDLYGGHGSVPLMDFTLAAGKTPHLKLTGSVDRCDLKPFMDDLYQRPQAMDGLLTANLDFDGEMLNYPTYKGRADYYVEQSAVVGSVFLTYWKELLQANSTTGGKDSYIDGRIEMSDERAYFRAMNLISPQVNMTADGYVDFRGRLDFDITASVISKRLQQVPVLSTLGDLWDMVGREIISYRLEGTLKAPRYYPVPTVLERLATIRGLVTRSREEMGSDRDRLIAPPEPPTPPVEAVP